MGEWESAKGGEVFAGPAIDRYPGRKEEQELPILVWEVPGLLPQPLSLSLSLFSGLIEGATLPGLH